MPPRIHSRLFQTIAQDTARGTSIKQRPKEAFSLPLRPFSSTSSTQHKSRNYKPRVYKDPWVLKRQGEKREAVLARRAADAERRAAAAGDPVRGASEPTAFVQSLDTGLDPDVHMLRPVEKISQTVAGLGADAASEAHGQRPQNAAANTPTAALTSGEADGPKPELLNHFLTQDRLASSLEESREFSSPYVSLDRSVADPAREEQELARHAELHAVRREALTRILAPENASGRERLILNKRRVIEKFGRHNTDPEFLGSGRPGVENAVNARERIGPDTGSSEVQIAILTAKIRSLADRLESRTGQFDWINKRNLRLLLHRRQKLLKYFEKKDRGGPRWRRLVETLGLTEATWKGEIELR